MLDAQNYVRTQVFTAVRAVYEGITTTSNDWDGEADLPALVFAEIDNYADASKSESGNRETCAVLTFEAQALSARSNAQCLGIIGVADEVMSNLGFSRTTTQTVGTTDPSVRRVVCRWRGRLTENLQVGR